MNGQDFATGKSVNLSKPEERVRQEYERVLVDDYGYLKNELDIEVSIPRGTGYFPDRADIVIYRSADGRDPTADIWGIVELKRSDRTDGLEQLKSYMTATSAEWGVWTNGEDIAYVCKPHGGLVVSEDYLNNIPARGQSVDNVGRLMKSDLKPFGREELKAAFRRILVTLYANTNISRREKLGGEMIKLIFSKIEDEKSYRDRAPEFRAEAGEDPEQVKRRLDDLFERVREELEQDGVFSPHETITLDARSLAWVVGQLERGSLLETDTDVVGDAFEVFASPRMAGEKGEFFTPRGVIQVAVKIANPKPGDTICDPACGSGGFLIHAMKHVWDAMESEPRWRGAPDMDNEKRRMAARSLFGIDKETDLVKIAKAYMAISGDGRSNIVHENSLHRADDFAPSAKQHFVDGDSFRQFDFVLTNPPYGTKTKVLKSDSRYFQFGHSWRLNKNDGKWEQSAKVVDRDPYVLFVERSLEMLKDGGVLGIVLPETVFHAPTLGYLRQFILAGNNLMAVVDLPHNTFRPHCNAKTCLFVVQKGVRQGDHVIMATPDEMGHDHNGNEIYRHGTSELWDDLAVVLDELDHPDSPENRFTFSVPWDKFDTNILVPRYYPGILDKVDMPDGRIGVELGNLVDAGVIGAWDGHGSPRSSVKGQGDIPYIRVNDIVNWELYRNPVSGVTLEEYERLTKNKTLSREGDVIFVRRGSYRIGTVAMASPRDNRVLLTRELLTLRILDSDNDYGITPFYLLALLSSPTVQKQVPFQVFMDTTMPNMGARWRNLVLPIHEDMREVERISGIIETAMRRKWDAQNQIDGLRTTLGNIIT